MDRTSFVPLYAWLGSPPWLGNLPDPILDTLQDIRIRRGRAVTLVCGERMFFPQRKGGVSALPGEPVVFSQTELDDLLCCLCGGAVHTHEEELRQGFISLPGGHRAGVCGQAAVENGRVLAVRQVTSVVIRLAREVPGCSRPLWQAWGKGAGGLLLAGPPSSGKTTVLRDLARTLADGRSSPRRLAVLDDRGEFASLLQDPFCTAEVLGGYPKAEGIARAIRYLGPEYLLCDEIATVEEAEALRLAAGAGCTVVAAIHAGSPEELRRRSLWEILGQPGLFSTLAFLWGKDRPGVLRCVERTEEHEMVWHSAVAGGLRAVGAVPGPEASAAGG